MISLNTMFLLEVILHQSHAVLLGCLGAGLPNLANAVQCQSFGGAFGLCSHPWQLSVPQLGLLEKILRMRPR